jgi:trypsin
MKMLIAIALLAVFTALCEAFPQSRTEGLTPYEIHVRNGGLPLPDAVREAHPEWITEESLNKSRIVGGSVSASGAIPWIVSLRQSSHFCGGSIITTRTIVSAAHCTYGTSASSISVRYNSLNHGSGGTLVSVSSIVNHASYSSSTLNNDISLLILSSALTLGQTQAQAVSLPSSGSDPSSGASTITAGWGYTTEGGSLAAALRQVTVPIVARSTCQSQYGTSSITTNMVCAGLTAGGADACQGDSGGPLTASGSLVGIVSWGNGCARPNYAGVYTRVGNYITWINNNAV